MRGQAEVHAVLQLTHEFMIKPPIPARMLGLSIHGTRGGGGGGDVSAQTG